MSDEDLMNSSVAQQANGEDAAADHAQCSAETAKSCAAESPEGKQSVDSEDEHEDVLDRAKRLSKERWIIEDTCRWTIFEDLEDELEYHRRRSRALSCFVQAHDKLGKECCRLDKECIRLEDAGINLQDEFEKLQDELNLTVGDVAYWRELAEARAEASVASGSPCSPAATSDHSMSSSKQVESREEDAASDASPPPKQEMEKLLGSTGGDTPSPSTADSEHVTADSEHAPESPEEQSEAVRDALPDRSDEMRDDITARAVLFEEKSAPLLLRGQTVQAVGSDKDQQEPSLVHKTSALEKCNSHEKPEVIEDSCSVIMSITRFLVTFAWACFPITLCAVVIFFAERCISGYSGRSRTMQSEEQSALPSIMSGALNCLHRLCVAPHRLPL